MPLPSTEGPHEALVNLKAVETGSAALQYTAPDKRKITDMYFTNRTSGSLTVTVHIVAPGDSPSNSNIFLGATPVPANDFRPVTGLRYALEKGFTIWAFASSTGINISIMGTLNR